MLTADGIGSVQRRFPGGEYEKSRLARHLQDTGFDESDKCMRSMFRGGLLLITAAVMTEVTLAGPDVDFAADNSQTAIIADFGPRSPDSIDVNKLLASPAFADPMASSADADLAAGEHPMIPLPSPLLVGFPILALVAMYAVRKQRATRPA